METNWGLQPTSATRVAHLRGGSPNASHIFDACGASQHLDDTLITDLELSRSGIPDSQKLQA